MADESETMAAAREEYRRKYGREMDEAPAPPPQQSYWERVKAVAGGVHRALKISPPHVEAAETIGKNMDYYRNLNQALSTPGGNEVGETSAFVRRFGSDQMDDAAYKARRQRDTEAVKRRIQGGQ